MHVYLFHENVVVGVGVDYHAVVIVAHGDHDVVPSYLPNSNISIISKIVAKQLNERKNCLCLNVVNVFVQYFGPGICCAVR